MRINVNLDNSLQLAAKQKAQSMGLNLSAYIRFLLASETKSFRDNIDRMVINAEKQGYEPFSMETLENDIKHAK